MRDLHMPGRSSVWAENGMVATSHPLAVQAALDILKRGGNAMDAAICGAVLLGICEPQMTGIGGDCFVLYTRAGDDTIRGLNGAGRAPAGAQANDLRDQGLQTIPPGNPHSVTIPGAIDAFCHLSETEGRIGLGAILAPAIKYAASGVPVAARVAFDWASAADILQDTALNHYLVGGTVPKEGNMFRLPLQANVLRRIAASGRDAFYTGEIAEDMVSTLQKLGGAHSLEDFAATKCEATTPITGPYKKAVLVEHPPNGQGATAILMLNILAQFEIAAMDPFGAERVHVEAEAAKLAYDARNRFIADAGYTTRLDHMISMDTAVALAALIDPNRTMASPTQASETVHKETIYITVVDRDRMAVSLIYSIFNAFGSGIASDKFGILLHNRGSGFNLIPGHPNEYGGGKRPMHTIIPAFLKISSGTTMPFGVMGAAYQANGHARFVSNLIDFSMDPQAAIDAPRSFHDGGVTKVERGYSDAVRQALSDKGHDVVVPDTPIGGAQTIGILPSGVLVGASDARKDGCALGY